MAKPSAEALIRALSASLLASCRLLKFSCSCVWSLNHRHHTSDTNAGCKCGQQSSTCRAALRCTADVHACYSQIPSSSSQAGLKWHLVHSAALNLADTPQCCKPPAASIMPIHGRLTSSKQARSSGDLHHTGCCRMPVDDVHHAPNQLLQDVNRPHP